MNVKKAFKFTIILLISLLAVFLFGCQQEPSLWRHQFGSGDDDIIQSIALDGLGNIYIAGMTFGSLSGQPSRGSSDAFIRKYDSSGNELWARQFGTAFMDSAEDIAIDKYNNVYLVGYTYNATSSQSYVSIDAFIRKYDGSGNELWTRQFGFGNEDHAYGVAIADNDMGAFPDITSIAGSDNKLRDPVGDYYAFGLDKDGYVIYGHDFIGDGTMVGLINYYRFQYTNFYYTVDSQGIVSQWDRVTQALESTQQ